MRALITGCAGFIGSHLAESLLEDGHGVLGVDCFNDNYGRRQKLDNLDHIRGWDSFEFIPIDLSRGDLSDLVAECDTVFHLAAEPGVRHSWGARFESYVRNNVMATQHLLEALVAHPGRRLVYASSSSIYGQAEEFPTSESARPFPVSPYGATKLHGEQLIDLYRVNFGVESVALRYFSVYGPRQRPDMAFHIFCRHFLEGEPLELFGGEQTRDFTYVADIVQATRTAAITDAAIGGAFNIGGGSRISLRDAVNTLSIVLGTSLETVTGPKQSGDVRDTAADISLAAETLGYAPKVGLADGLAAEFEWLREAVGRIDVGV